MSVSNRASLNGERKGFDRTYDASATEERRFDGLKLLRPEIFKRQHGNMHRWDECPFRRVEKPCQGDEPWSTESHVDFNFQTSISVKLQMQGFSVAYESEYSWERELPQQRLRRAYLRHLVDCERRRGKYRRYHRGNKYRLNRFWVGEDLDKKIAELETTVEELSGDISDRSVTPEQKQTSSNPRDSEAIRFSRSPYAYSYQELTIKGNPWTSLFSAPVNSDDDWTKISEEPDAWGRGKSAEWKAGAGRKKSWKRCPVAKVAKKTQQVPYCKTK